MCVGTVGKKFYVISVYLEGGEWSSYLGTRYSVINIWIIMAKNTSKNSEQIVCKNASMHAARLSGLTQSFCDGKDILCFCEGCDRWVVVDRYRRSASKLLLCADCYCTFNEAWLDRAYQIGLTIVLVTLFLAISVVFYSRF